MYINVHVRKLASFLEMHQLFHVKSLWGQAITISPSLPIDFTDAMIYAATLSAMLSVFDSSFQKYPQRSYLGALMNIVWAFPTLYLVSPPLMTLFVRATAGSHPSSRMTPHGPGCWRRRALISGERGEQVEEIEKRTKEE